MMQIIHDVTNHASSLTQKKDARKEQIANLSTSSSRRKRKNTERTQYHTKRKEIQQKRNTVNSSTQKMDAKKEKNVLSSMN